MTNRLRNLLILGPIAAAMSLGLGGCKTTGADSALLTEENQGLRTQLTERNSALESNQMDLMSKDEQIMSLEQQLRDSQNRVSSLESMQYNEPAYTAQPVVDSAYPVSDPFEGIAGVQGSYSAGEVTAVMESDVLFDSGKSQLRSSAKKSLNAVANILKSDYSGKPIRVGGHTDTDPIRKSGFKSNYHLGFERAYAVREYLISRGVPDSQVYVASYGPAMARGTKKQSRRVEIAVVLNET